jgi:hypothetical protein
LPPACHRPDRETASDRAAWISSDYHGKSFATELTKRCASDSLEKLAGAVAGAQVDLNPHQVDAALFAFNSPLSKGALLADEAGLGKPWKYLLIPHDAVAENMTIEGMAAQFDAR